MRRTESGFTLIELLVVLSLLAVLMGLSAGFIQRAGRGNLLLQTSNQLAAQLASARAQSFGNDRAYVAIEAAEEGHPIVRTYRNRQVFFWPCEDFEKYTDAGSFNMQRVGNVTISDTPGREGRFAVFESGSMDLGDPPWLDFQDGFSLRCRIRPSPSASGAQTLFRKGEGLEVQLLPGGEAGRIGIEAKIHLVPREGAATTGGSYLLRTGMREGAELAEWASPLLPGRWYELRIVYDRNQFTIHVDDKLRAVRTDKRERMKTSNDRFVVGGGYQGGFDSLVVAGIFEDDNDRYEVPPAVTWIDEQGKAIKGSEYVHFTNRTLDPHFHAAPVNLIFRLDQDQEGHGARRAVTVTLSGETFVKRPE